MDLKQAYIKLGWEIDDSNLKTAQSLTDELVDTIKKNGVSASNDFANSFRTISDKVDSTKAKIKDLIDTQKSINDVQMNRPGHDMDSFNASVNHSIDSVDRLKDKLSSLNGSRAPLTTRPTSSGVREEDSKPTGGISLGKTVIGGAVGGLVGGAIANVGSYISSMSKMAFTADQAAQKVQLAWTTMGVKSASSVKDLTSQIGDLTKQANISGADTTAVQQSLYNATNGNISQTKALTNEVFAFGKATGQSDDQIVQATGSLGRLFNTTKVRGNTFTRITKQMPAMRNAIIAASGESSAKFMADMNAGKISGTELRDLMVKAASQSGKAWDDYGKTAGGAIAKLEGTQTQIWKDTFKQMAGTSNEGLVQLSNLVQKNEQPIAEMMGGIGKGLANIASGAINFLVANQRPLGSIADSLVSIGKTIGSAVWSTFSGIIQGVGTAFGLVSGNSKKSESPMQTFANIMKEIADHKDAIKFIATTLTGMFVAKKALAFASSLKEVAGAIGLINTAEAGSSKGGLLNDLMQNSGVSKITSQFGREGGRGRNIVGNFSKQSIDPNNLSFGKSDRTLSKNIKGTNLASKGLFKGVSGGLEDASVGPKEYAKDMHNYTSDFKFGSIKSLSGDSLGSYASDIGKASKFGKLGSLLSDSKLLTGARTVASKVPFLDIAAAGTQLIGMNRKNAGGKIGAAGGMLGGTMGGAAAGAALGSVVPIVGTGVGGLVGGAVGGIAGSAGGKWLGQKIQSVIPKGDMKAISSTMSSIGKSIHSTFDSIGKSFKPVTKGFSDFINAAKKSVIVRTYIKSVGDEFKFFGNVVGIAFRGVFSVVKGITVGIGTFLKDEFGGIFKTIGGIFKAGADLLTGKWSNLGGDLKQIGSGILETMEAPFQGAWAAIKSIGSDIINFVSGIWKSISNMGKKVADIARHPIKSIESLFASGSNRYQNGLPKTTRAVVNDGNGPELINFGNGFGMYKGRNVHTVLPKGAHVYTAADTRKMVGEQAFAGGTTSLNANVKIGKNNLAESIQTSGRLANSNFIKMSRSLNNKNMQLHDKMFRTNADSAKKINANNQSLSDKTVGNFTDMGKQLDPIWSKTVDAFGNYFNQLGPNAKNGMQGAVDALNQGISGIDKTLQQFGGNDSVLSPIHYAHGTDGVANKDHMAIVNDAKSGPQMEAIVNQAGQARYVSGTNAKTVIRKGESVLTGTDTLTAINEGLIPHYAKGKSSKSALRSLAKTNAKNAKNAFNTEFTNNVKLTGSGLQKGLTKMGTNASTNDNNGYKWSNAMWKVISSAIQGSGPASGLLGAVEKYGTGKKYVWGATGPDAFDCSGLVQYALKNAFGISYPRTSGMQISKAAGISRSEAQPGDLIGNSEHIGVVADKGARHYFSAFNPSSHPNILMTPVNGSYFPGTPKFGRVSGIKNKNAGSSSGIKGVTKFMKQLVTAELGSNALNSITKSLSVGDGGASGNPAGDGVNRWKPDVIKALGALHLSTSGNMVDRVLRQINTESSGNPNTIGGTDGLNDGRAMGLMQVKPGTFSAYGRPDLGKWNNGYASIYAGLNYAKHRYGDSLSFLGQGHGYASGGRPHVGETAWVGERGPELVHFDSPASIESNTRSVSTLRRQQSSGGNNVTVARGAITITVQAANNATETAKRVSDIVNQNLHKIFHEAKKDVEGGTI